MIIDAKNISSKEIMDKFLSLVKVDDVILISADDLEIVCRKNTLKDSFKSEKLLTYAKEHDKAEIIIATEENMLLLTSYDVTWWNENTRRINKLFKNVESITQETTYGIACGSVKQTSEGNEIVDIHTFKGNKKEMIDFINKEITDRTLQSFMTDKILFSMDYLEEKHSWKTIDELLETGVFV